MVKRHVRVYIEGGAEGREAGADFRRGWKKFLKELHCLARKNGYQALEVVRGKGRTRTFNLFKEHKRKYPNDLCVLLVDAETAAPEGTGVWSVVERRKEDQWQRPHWATESHLYLMVHTVETWLLTDQDALRQFFKRSFNPKPLPSTNLESRSKKEIEEALDKATEGKYRHGQSHEIIGLVSQDRVKTLRHGERLFSSLDKLIREGV